MSHADTHQYKDLLFKVRKKKLAFELVGCHSHPGEEGGSCMVRGL